VGTTLAKVCKTGDTADTTILTKERGGFET